ncbi:formate/nitrite transporter FocA (FNT family) [Enterococcus faecalis]
MQNTLWVFLGNAVGGSLFMAVPLIFMTKPATVKPRVEKTIQTEELYGN